MVNVEGVALAQLREKGSLPLIDHGKGAFGFLLAGEQVHHGVDRIRLEYLVFEFQLHGNHALLYKI